MSVRSIFAPNLFHGRVALITGGGTGIGLRTAKEFLQLGGCVVICSRKENVITAAVDTLNKLYPPYSPTNRPRAIGRACNIRDHASIQALCEWIQQQPHVGSDPASVSSSSARIDYLINNAGGQFPSLASAISPKGWSAVIETNLTGTFLMSQAVFNHFFEKQGAADAEAAATAASSSSPASIAAFNPIGGCAIVTVVANMHNGFPGMSHTGAARAAVVNLTKSLSVEWASAGVRINALAPGVIASSGLSNYNPAMQEMIAATSAGNNYAARLGSEAECAAAILFLLSPASAFTTGACLNMDGGESLYSPMMRPASHTLNMAWDDGHEGEDTRPLFLRGGGAVNASKAASESSASGASSSAASSGGKSRAANPYAQSAPLPSKL